MRLGLSLSPSVDGNGSSGDLLDLVATSATAGARVVLLGDRAPSDAAAVRSHDMLVAAALGTLRPGTTAGMLFLAPDWPRHLLLRSTRTLVELAARCGVEPSVALAAGRPGRGTDTSASPEQTRAVQLDGAIQALRTDPTARHVPVWVPAERGRALVRAGSVGDVWLANAQYLTVELARQIEVVREAADAAGVPVPSSAVRRDVVCASTDAEADRLAREALAAGYRGGKLGREALVVGSPARCEQQIEDLASLGFDTVLVRPVANGARAADHLERFFSQVHVDDR